MSKKKLSIISVDRAKTILACYGSQPSAWPEPERDALQRILKGSEILTTLQLEELAVDQFMGFSDYAKKESIHYLLTEQCAEKIMDRLPEQEQITIPSTATAKITANYFNRPLVLVASLMLLALSLSNHLPFNQQQDAVISLAEFMAIYDDEQFMSSDSPELSDDLSLLAYIEPQLLEDFI